jgi:ankyrin repeat protein
LEAAGDYDNAILNVKLYLLFKLSDADARAAHDKIYALEARQEKQDLGPKLVNALHKYPYEGINVQEVLALINAGADVNTKIHNENGKPLLSWAVLSGLTDIVRAMLDKGANVNAADSDGTTVLMQACLSRNSLDLVPLLIGKGANVNAAGREGKSVLVNCSCDLQGSSQSASEVERLLINAGANLNTQDNYGHTALYYVEVEGSYCKSSEISHILRAAGAR